MKTWIDGHGAKVVAAIVRTDTDAKTRKAIHTAVGKLVDGGDPVAWSEGFFHKTEPEPKRKKSDPPASAKKKRKSK